MPFDVEALEKRAGPLPVWGWGVAIGIVVVAVWWFHGQTAGGAAAPVDTSTLTDPQAIDDAALSSGNDAGAGSPTGPVTNTPGVARTNRAWLAQVLVYETGKGRNALKVQRACSLYLAGKKLTDPQRTIVNEAITHVGLPPRPPKTVPPPKPTNPPGGGSHGTSLVPSPVRDVETNPIQANHAVEAYGTYAAGAGDTAASVAHAVYGESTPFHIEKVRQANGIGSTDQFTTGQLVKVPHV